MFQKEEKRDLSRNCPFTAAGITNSSYSKQCLYTVQFCLSPITDVALNKTTDTCVSCVCLESQLTALTLSLSLSLQPFEHPVCTPEGAIFDLLNIIPYLKKFGHNPVSGQVCVCVCAHTRAHHVCVPAACKQNCSVRFFVLFAKQPMDPNSLVRLHFHKNKDGKHEHM